MRFLGLGLADAVPDANTIWTFCEAPKKANPVDALLQRFDATLREAGSLAMSAPDCRRAQAAQQERRRRRSRKGTSRTTISTRLGWPRYVSPLTKLVGRSAISAMSSKQNHCSSPMPRSRDHQRPNLTIEGAVLILIDVAHENEMIAP